VYLSAPGRRGNDNSPGDYEPSTEPEPIYPVYFEPMPGAWYCNVWNPDADYPTEVCHWVEFNDAKIPSVAGQTTLSRTAAAGETALSTSPGDAKSYASVFVIVSDSLPKDAMAVLERRTMGPYKNVILVPSSTIRPAVLAAAMRFLYDSRAKYGETPSVTRISQLSGTLLDQNVSSAARSNAVPFADLLAAAAPRDMGRYGRKKTLVLRLTDLGSTQQP